MEIIGFWYNVV